MVKEYCKKNVLNKNKKYTINNVSIHFNPSINLLKKGDLLFYNDFIYIVYKKTNSLYDCYVITFYKNGECYLGSVGFIESDDMILCRKK